MSEFDIRFVDGDGGFETFLVQRSAARREESRGRQPEAAAIRQPDQFLLRGATDRVFADEIRALVADERRREQLRAARRAGVDQQRRRKVDAAVAASRPRSFLCRRRAFP